MQKARKEIKLPDPYSEITLYADLSKHTMQACPLNQIIYRNHNVIYRWGFPAKLLVTWEGKYTVLSVEAGMQLVEQWSLLSAEQQPDDASPAKVDPLWNKVPG